MKKVLIVYFSTSGKTEQMANYIAEGIRFCGFQAKVKKLGEIKKPEDIIGYDGYILGSPTFSLDIPNQVKTLFTMLKDVKLAGKLSGAFGPYLHDASYQHDTHAPARILDILQKESKIKTSGLGALSLREDILETRDGLKACQEYGRIFGQQLEN